MELAGSARPAPVGDRVSDVPPEELASVTVYLRGRASPTDEVRVTRAAYAERFGALEADVDAVARTASALGLAVGDVDPARRSVQLWGTLAGLAGVFGTSLGTYRSDRGASFRGREGALSVPRDIAHCVTAVVGLDTRPQAHAQFQIRAAASVQYTPPQVAAAYGYPPGLTGTGECIALIELGGGFRTADLQAYFASLGLAVPSVVAVSVDGALNSPSAPDGPDGEVLLDVEVVGSIAPGARVAVYFAPNTDQGFLDAVTTAVHDQVQRPSVVSISWGGAEATWTSQAMDQMETALAAAAALGVTVTVAAGDGGSTDGQQDGLQHVDFPASAPHALGCGGTSLRVQAGAIETETVWNDPAGATGGGVSDAFSVPSYQAGAHVPPSANPGGHLGRGVPDVCGDADPDTGYTVRVDGEVVPIGGTSAVAPLWAGLVALLNEGLGHPVGFLNPFLYAQAPSTVLTDVVTGSNGAYDAAPGWDPCSGLGSPRGAALLAALRASTSPAG